ncbi:MAG: polyphosphate kinase 1, partial [Gemmatimonadales bacterium]
PVPQLDGTFDLNDPVLLLNRELTWLNFNFRVLAQAEDPRTPLLERLKFIGIVDSNLDEFFMKRIGGLRQQVGAGVQTLSADGRTPQKQIDEAYDLVRTLVARQRNVLSRLRGQLAKQDVRILKASDLDVDRRAALRKHYFENIYPLVTPQATDPAHPFPFVSNLSLNLLVTLKLPSDEFPSIARVKVPVGVDIERFLAIDDSTHFVPLESVISDNLDLLFPGMEILSCALFRVTRNANTEIEGDEADDLLAQIETELRHRILAPIVRLEVGADMDPHLRVMLATEFGLDEEADVFEVGGMIGLGDVQQIASLDIQHLRDAPHHPVDHPSLADERSVFDVIREQGSILLHHPFESFATSVERMLKEASEDPKVRAIKMTMYRTSADSLAVDHLIDAARNGKQVTVVMELKARFDEAANIRWADRLSKFGISVTFGVVGLKSHGKAILIVRQESDGLRRYVHIATGNYHAGTARVYSDLGLLTCDPQIGADLTELFNYLTTGYKPKRQYKKPLPAPKFLKPALLKRIRSEARHAKAGRPARIQIKVNALEDPGVTIALYQAARAGVQVDLIVRDSCRIRPGIPGLSENVRVISIVGRFLEHSRIYYFLNNGKEEYWIGSADVMRRNLGDRVETLVPVEDPVLRQDLRFVLDMQLADKRSGWEMRSDGSYERCGRIDSDAPGTHQLTIDWAEERYRDATRLKRRKPRGLPG